MRIVIRKYQGKGAKELFDLIDQKKGELQSLMHSISGYVSYTLARTSEGGISVTVCQDESGITESVKRAKEWIAKNAGNTGAGSPEIISGNVI